MDDMLKIIRINAYIQRKMGKISLDDKEVLCVALDRTVTFTGEGEDEQELTDVQLDGLFRQTFGFLKEQTS